MSPQKDARVKTNGGEGKAAQGFTKEEQAAMKERARELKAEARRASSGAKTDGEAEVLAKIAEMPAADRVIAEKIHTIIQSVAPELTPRTWYGMPAYARDGKVLCFFQAAQKFKARYALLGFNDSARLDDGNMWATSFAIKKLTAAEQKKIKELIEKAIG